MTYACALREWIKKWNYELHIQVSLLLLFRSHWFWEEQERKQDRDGFSVTSQILPHFQFFSIKGVSLSLPPLPSRWLCSPAAISWVGFGTRIPLHLPLSSPLPTWVHHPHGWAWANCTGSNAVSKTSSRSSPAQNPTFFGLFWREQEGREGAAPSRSHV